MNTIQPPKLGIHNTNETIAQAMADNIIKYLDNCLESGFSFTAALNIVICRSCAGRKTWDLVYKEFEVK